MGQRRVSITDIEVGTALQFDVYAPSGKLLLRRGQVLQTQHQIERLVEEGMLIVDEADGLEASRRWIRGERDLVTPPSVVDLVRNAFVRLQQAVLQYHSAPEQFKDRIHEAAAFIEHACHQNRDIALATIPLKRDERYSLSHSLNTAIVTYVVALGMEKQSTWIQSAVCAALTMNIGMLELQDDLQKQQDPLSEEQKAVVHAHPRKSTDMLEAVGVDDTLWLAAVLQHHEQADGSGYPHGLTGENISEAAKLVQLADLYTARVTPRAYRTSVQSNVALRDIFLERGKGVDPMIAAHFIKDIGIYPPGTLVRLLNGEVAVVSHQTGKTNTPIVHSLIGPRGAPLGCAIRRNTADERYAIRDVIDTHKLDIKINMVAIWGKEAA